ncbi:MAG: ceramidase domain-containing protein [Candidatus Obscuribacterales bacterium]|nr:ceramidase domain-containing protein [Steroidobacteraceae bacterium]
MQRRSVYLIVLWVIGIAAVVIAALQPPISQPIAYHHFADRRTLLGIPNFWNVVSNMPFLLVGVLGLIEVVRGRYPGGLSSLRIAYGAFFVFIGCVCFGSGYYHWAPSNATLAWDRLPMAIAFMIFLSIVISEHINERVGLWAIVPLVAIGIFSVWYWDYTETLGRGDLRPYGLVQFLSLILLLLIFWLFPSRLTGIGYLWVMFGGYALAKVLEELDAHIYAVGGAMSGHALKHVVAAVGMYFLLLALRQRRPRE